MNVQCHYCLQEFIVNSNFAGKEVRCGNCGEFFWVPIPRTVASASGLSSEKADIRSHSSVVPKVATERHVATVQSPPPLPNFIPDPPNQATLLSVVSPSVQRAKSFAPHRGPIILTLGILSWLTACVFLAPFVWAMAAKDLKLMRRGYMDYGGYTMTQFGYIFGIINTICAALLIPIIVFLLIVDPKFIKEIIDSQSPIEEYRDINREMERETDRMLREMERQQREMEREMERQQREMEREIQYETERMLQQGKDLERRLRSSTYD